MRLSRGLGRVFAMKWATPAWADRKAIARLYRVARRRSLRGEACEVDHIVPLNHPTVCGLHCEKNLRIVRQDVNRARSNHCWPYAWHEPHRLDCVPCEFEPEQFEMPL